MLMVLVFHISEETSWEVSFTTIASLGTCLRTEALVVVTTLHHTSVPRARQDELGSSEAVGGSHCTAQQPPSSQAGLLGQDCIR